ncbi:arabinose metabolism transcriptional repressor [Ruminiclostridium hungatei]|uniref:Arabinose metabolism transcriptional repressor n=1 Tax=Ruminiclostridium hungatei TaxID=48256 RepID=A0A1V4SQU4_RUMHU|nr:GntR family transcriptional regulator [Ruminiclostridium hungatei]OPX45607.1 arabinose metabolism transcriptional repressor [Ruminiclostridium hungatei]
MINAPKYTDIVEWTIAQIESKTFNPNDRFLSETELGEKFGFSRQTVRRALEVLEQRGHITRIQGRGTYIADVRPQKSSVFKHPSRTVGIISTYLDNYIFPSIVRGIEGVLSEAGFAVQLASTNNSVEIEARSLQLMLDRQVDGLIIVPTRSALPCLNLDLYKELIRHGIPVVFIDSFYPELSIPHVALDDVMSGYMATQHLLEMGHRDILGIFSHINRQGHLRYQGYARALSENGIPLRDELVFWYSKESLLQQLQGGQLLECLSKSTSALCFNDHMALLLMDYLRQNGKSVPGDFSVVGIDNSELANISSLTSIVHPSEELGETAARQLLSMIGGAAVENILFPPQLKKRGSVLQHAASALKQL